MEEGVDKTRVLDVKPLRSLVPVFPSSGSLPSGSFYPFTPMANTSAANIVQSTPVPTPSPAPLRAVQPPPTNESHGRGWPPKSSSPRKKAKKLSSGFAAYQSDKFVLGINDPQKEDGNRDLVINVITRYDALRRRILQLEDAKDSNTGKRHANLRAGTILMSKGVRTNMRKRIGEVPGVEIGDIFFFRLEMCLVGLHAQSMAGIDYMIVRGDSSEDPLAVSIVSSGVYDDEVGDEDVLVYTGQGGNATNIREAADQKLKRGNLALEKSLHRGTPVRVIRGMKDMESVTSRVYIYDGLYTVQESWVEKGKTGCNTFKYKLIRMPGQPSAFADWKSIEKWKGGGTSRSGLVLPDLTSGAESIPVSLVNDVDGERGPAYFTYDPTVKYGKSFKLTQATYGCSCRTACSSGDLNCSCIRKNDGDFPYTGNSLLVSRKPYIYECGPACPCGPNCKNRVSQSGVKFHLEVFKTKDRGWGLRSWDPIRAGSFICLFAGEVMDKAKETQDADVDNNDFLLDTTRTFTPFKWNCEPGLIEEDSSDDTEENKFPFSVIVNSKNVGNVARFMNHSCSPNTFWQPVIYEHINESFMHVAMYAMRHIPPMKELTYDYGSSSSGDVDGNDAPQGKKKCLCGSANCLGYFG